MRFVIFTLLLTLFAFKSAHAELLSLVNRPDATIVIVKQNQKIFKYRISNAEFYNASSSKRYCSLFNAKLIHAGEFSSLIVEMRTSSNEFVKIENKMQLKLNNLKMYIAWSEHQDPAPNDDKVMVASGPDGLMEFSLRKLNSEVLIPGGFLPVLVHAVCAETLSR